MEHDLIVNWSINSFSSSTRTPKMPSPNAQSITKTSKNKESKEKRCWCYEKIIKSNNKADRHQESEFFASLMCTGNDWINNHHNQARISFINLIQWFLTSIMRVCACYILRSLSCCRKILVKNAFREILDFEKFQLQIIKNQSDGYFDSLGNFSSQ